MDYIKVTVTILKGDCDTVCEMLSGMVSGFEIDDPSVIDDIVNSRESRWDYIEEGLYENPDRNSSVSFYLENGEEGERIFEKISAVLSTDSDGKYEIRCAEVKSEDWENNWKEFYKPFKIGKKLYLRPSWETINDTEGRTVLVMDPASSFGTGSHATTRLCMECLDSIDCQNANVLDMGCGSGILGVCAMLLGAGSTLFCDIEENAVKTAGDNAVINGIDKGRCAFLCGDVIKGQSIRQSVLKYGPYDIILANIVADVLKAMAPYFKEWLKKEGKLILSGIINERAEEVRLHFENMGFKVIESLSRDGWTMLLVTYI